MSRSKDNSDKNDIVFTLRIPEDYSTRLEAAAEHLSSASPGLSVTKADVGRMAIHEWLATHEKGVRR